MVTAVPGFMGYKVLEVAINYGKNIVGISFFPEDVLQLAKLAKEKGVTVITDCGVAPGMSNFIIGRHNEEIKTDFTDTILSKTSFDLQLTQIARVINDIKAAERLFIEAMSIKNFSKPYIIL